MIRILKIIVSPSATSSYTVIGYDIQGCSSQASITQVVDQCLGVRSEKGFIEFEFYPNPVNDILFFKMEEISTEIELEIYSSIGELLFLDTVNESVGSIKTDALSPGIYFVNFTKNGQIIINKSFIKQ